MRKQKFYLSTAIPYVNAAPHLGFSLEIVQADAIARYHRLIGDDVFFLTGTDENSLKNVRAAQEEGISVQALCDKYAARFKALKETLNLSYDGFIRTSDKKRHWPGAQKLWQACDRAGDIYQKDYQGWYCVGCEEFKTKKDLVNGRCHEHPETKLEFVKEKNYFFRLSKYQRQIERLIASDEVRIVPQTRKNEVLSFIRQTLKDFSISRSVERAKDWGIPVPGDPSSIQFVWFDALSNYLTGIGYGWDEGHFGKWWPADLHVIGKGIVKFHAIYWIGMLLSAKLSLPKSVFIHGYLTCKGKKISKSLGNVIDPFEMTKKYGTDTIRYFLLRKIHPYQDGDFSLGRFKEVYNADLANGLGNLVQRVAKLAERAEMGAESPPEPKATEYHQFLKKYKFNECLAWIWKKISSVDKYIDQTKPWEKKGKELVKVLAEPIQEIREIAYLLKPFLPETAEKIEKRFADPEIKIGKPLFPRI